MKTLTSWFRNTSVKAPVKEVTVQEIHDKVDWYSLYTKDVLQEDLDKKIHEKQSLSSGFLEQIQRRKNVGFALTKQQEIEEKQINENLQKLSTEIEALRKEKEERKIVNDMRIKYPQRKFIYMKDLEELCTKYQLAIGYTIDYIGELPEKNLIEIENYKKPEEALDIVEKEIDRSWDSKAGQMVSKTKLFAVKPYFQEFTVAGAEAFVNSKFNKEFETSLWLGISQKLAEYKYTIENFGYGAHVGFFRFNANRPINTFMIACPAQNLIKTINDVKVSYIEDPIVFYPVKHAFCLEIISKWGIEASDEKLLNPINN